MTPQEINRHCNGDPMLCCRGQHAQHCAVTVIGSLLYQISEANEALATMAERLDGWINQCAAMEQTIVELRDELAQAKGGVK